MASFAGVFVLLFSLLATSFLPSDSAATNAQQDRNLIDLIHKNTPERIPIASAIRSCGWQFKLQLNPFVMACMNGKKSSTANKHKSNYKWKRRKVCNEDDSICDFEWYKAKDYTTEQMERGNSLKGSCDDVEQSYQMSIVEKSGLLVLCYESLLDPTNDRHRLKPAFHLSNIDGNPIASVCQRNANNPHKIWHGLGFEFWITRDADNDEGTVLLMVHMRIHFSFSDEKLTLPIVKKDVLNSKDARIPYDFIFGSITTFIDGAGLKGDDFMKPLFANGRNAFQKATGLWLALLDMKAKQNGSELVLLFYQNNCQNFKVFLNGIEAKPADCKTRDDRIRQMEEEAAAQQKIVEVNMDEVHKLEQNCTWIDPVIPDLENRQPPPELRGQQQPVIMEKPDILLTPEQAEEILNATRKKCEKKNSIKKRQIGEVMFSDYTDLDNYKWSDKRWNPGKFPIVYTFQHYQKEAWINQVEHGVNKIREATCITFEHNTKILLADGQHMDFIYFRDNGGCFSPLGRQKGANKVNASEYCSSGSVAHEIMHNFGFEHEHVRSDRDNHVWIIENSIYAYQYAFDKKHGAKNLGLPYDFGSIMHYPATGFGKKDPADGGSMYTIIAKERAYQQTMGQRFDLSFKDAKMLNRIYCEHICPTKLPCANNGYTDPSDCSKCRCPNGFAGTRCDRFDRGDEEECHSGRFYADITEKYIETSNVMNGARKCIWTIKTLQIKQMIMIRINMLENFKCSQPCQEDNFLEVHMRKDKTSRGARLCCASAVPYQFTLEPGVDALITLARSSDKQQFQLTYYTPTAVEPEESFEWTAACACDKVFNPWHAPKEAVFDEKPEGVSPFFRIAIKSRSNLIINGKYRFFTQDGTVWFERTCAGNENEKHAFAVWKEPKSGAYIKIDDIIAEECMIDYERSGCAELNSVWKTFLDCLTHSSMDTCNKDGNFRITNCGSGPRDPNTPQWKPGVN